MLKIFTSYCNYLIFFNVTTVGEELKNGKGICPIII